MGAKQHHHPEACVKHLDFTAPPEAGLPLLTSVSPRFTEAWDRFAAPFYVVLPARLEAIESWWRNVRADAETTAG